MQPMCQYCLREFLFDFRTDKNPFCFFYFHIFSGRLTAGYFDSRLSEDAAPCAGKVSLSGNKMSFVQIVFV